MSLFGVSKINQQISMIGLANVLEVKWIKSCQLTQFYWRDYLFISCALCYPHYPILLIPKITHTHKNFVIVWCWSPPIKIPQYLGRSFHIPLFQWFSGKVYLVIIHLPTLTNRKRLNQHISVLDPPYFHHGFYPWIVAHPTKVVVWK